MRNVPCPASQKAIKLHQFTLTMGSYNNPLLPCLHTIPVLYRDSHTVICGIRHVTSPIYSRIDWLTGSKISIIGLSFTELEMGKTVHLKLNLTLAGRNKHRI